MYICVRYVVGVYCICVDIGVETCICVDVVHTCQGIGFVCRDIRICMCIVKYMGWAYR